MIFETITALKPSLDDLTFEISKGQSAPEFLPEKMHVGKRSFREEYCFMSSLIYVIQLWGGANKSLISLLQIQQNKAARFVTRLGHRTSVKILLQQCGWLSVRQLVIYHDCLFVYKVMQYSKPVYFQEKFQSHSQFEPFEEPVSFRTRLNCTGEIRMDGKTKSDLNRQSFVHVSSQAWNSLPAQIRQAQKIDSFKRSLKAWIQQHIDIE